MNANRSGATTSRARYSARNATQIPTSIAFNVDRAPVADPGE